LFNLSLRTFHLVILTLTLSKAKGKGKNLIDSSPPEILRSLRSLRMTESERYGGEK
jgi:hypothetical protein